MIASNLVIMILVLVPLAIVDGNGNGKDDRVEGIFEYPINESANMMCGFMGYGANVSERHQCKSDLMECLNRNSYDACTVDKYNQTIFPK